MAISTNEIKIKYVIDDTELRKAATSFDNLTKEEQDAINSMKKFNTELSNTGNKATETGKKLEGAFSQANGGLDNFSKGLGGLGPLIAGAFTATAVLSFGKAVFEVTSNFEKMAAVLKNTLGSGAQASLALENIKTFAKSTPFSVQELTASFVKLANQGFKPTNDQLRKLGDLASSTGKSFDQLTEAIIDAQTGEFERLKEFNILAKKQGDQVIFSFHGVETQVKFSNEAIRQYITSLGDYTGVAGSAAAVSATLGGKVNNLGDAWDNFLNKVGTLLKPVLQGALEVTADFMDQINNLFGKAQSDAERYSATELGAFQFAQGDMLTMTMDQLDAMVLAQKKKLTEAANELKTYQEKANNQDFLIKAAAKIGLGMEDNVKAAKVIEAINIDIANIKGKIAAAEEQIKLRNDATAKTEKIKAEYLLQQSKEKAEQDKADKKQYDLRLKQLDLERQIMSLQAKIRGSKLGELGAERNYAEGVYSLKKEYSAKNIGISKDEVKVAQLTAKERTKAFDDAANGELLATKQVADITGGIRDKTAKDDQKYFDAKLQKIKDNLDAEVKATKDAEAKKQAILKGSFELAFTLTDGFTNLYTANIDREITALNRRANEEIRMADGNQQKIDEINQRKAAKERELKIKAFNAEKTAAIARVVFETASIVAKWLSSPTTIPLAALTLANQAAQIGFIFAQPTPEFAEGTKGKPFEGGQAIVGERGVEKVVTQSGKVYFTPNKASLVELPKGSQVIPHHQLTREERFLASSMSSGASSANPMIGELRELGSLIKNMPITQVSMDERGFEKFIRTPRRTTKILNNRFRSNS